MDASAPSQAAMRAEPEAGAYPHAAMQAARSRALHRVGQLITGTLSLDAVLQNAVDAIRDHLDERHTIGVLLVAPDNPELLVLRAFSGAFAVAVTGEYRQRIDQGIIGLAFTSRQPILVNDAQHDPRYLRLPGLEATYGALSVPIAAGAERFGVLHLESRAAVTAEDAADFGLIADQLAVAIQNARSFADTQQLLSQTELLYQTSRRISTAMNVEQVIAAYLDQVAARGSYGCFVALHEFAADGSVTAAVIRGRWSPDGGANLEPLRMPYIEDELTPALDAGTTVAIGDIHADSRVSPIVRATMDSIGARALAMIPLLARDHRIGLVVLSSTHTTTWSDAALQPYQTTAAQLASAIDSRQQHILLSERSRLLAVLEERRRISRELHDSATQSLFSMSLLAQVLPDLWRIDQQEAREALQQIQQLTRSTLAEMRSLLFQLRAPDETAQRLEQAVQAHIAAFEQRTGLRVTAEVEPPGELPPAVAHGLARITQEALTNIARHAAARHVRVVLRGGDPLRLQIEDDGQGFAVDHSRPGSFGLPSMRERATLAGARLEVRSAPGQGTTISVSWPAGGQELSEEAR